MFIRVGMRTPRMCQALVDLVCDRHSKVGVLVANTCEITDDGAEMLAMALMGKYDGYIATK